MVFFFCFYFQAIQNPNDEALQEQAWAAVVPLVGKLKKFYEFSQRLGMHLSLLCLQEPYSHYYSQTEDHTFSNGTHSGILSDFIIM